MPPHPTPAPQKVWKLKQKLCDGYSCQRGCVTKKFPTQTCLPVIGGGYAIATCHQTQGYVHVQDFWDSACTQSDGTDDMSLDECELSDQGGSQIDTCVYVDADEEDGQVAVGQNTENVKLALPGRRSGGKKNTMK